MEYKAQIIESTQLPGQTLMSIRFNVLIDGEFDHEKELDVKAVAYQDGIKTYLREYQEAQEAAAAISPGEVISL